MELEIGWKLMFALIMLGFCWATAYTAASKTLILKIDDSVAKGLSEAATATKQTWPDRENTSG